MMSLLTVGRLLARRFVVPAEKLTCEGALYWQCLCSFLKGQGTEGEMLLDRMLPNVSVFSLYIRRCVSVEDNHGQFTIMV